MKTLDLGEKITEKVTFKFHALNLFKRVGTTIFCVFITALMFNIPFCVNHTSEDNGIIIKSDSINTFYSYGKFINYEDDDLTQPRYVLFTSIDSIPLNKKTFITEYGKWIDNTSTHRYFNKQQTNNILKYDVKYNYTTQNYYLYLTINNALALFAVFCIIIVISLFIFC